MWGEHYQRKFSDLANLQQELARDISEQLRPKLSPNDQKLLQPSPTENSEAYQLYLQGNFFYNKRKDADHERAIEFYREAIEKDPRFALAYVGIADAYALMPLNGNVAPGEALPKAKEAALHALAIDPNLSEAHSALGRILLSYEYDFAGAEKELQRANELNPNSVNNKLWTVELLAASSRFTEAFATVRRAMELDPFSAPASGFVGRIY